MRVWVDASTLIALDTIGELAFLRNLMGRVAITAQIADEVFSGRESQASQEARGSWIDVVPVRGDLSRWTDLGLGRGEASSFETPKRDRLVLDELPTRAVAEAEGRDYVGLLGLLLAATARGAITPSRGEEIVRKLARSPFRMSTDLYDEVLRQLEGRS